MLSDVPLGCKVKEKEIKRATQLKSTITCCEQLMQLDQTSLEGELYPVYKDMREVNHFFNNKNHLQRMQTQDIAFSSHHPSPYQDTDRFLSSRCWSQFRHVPTKSRGE